MSEQPTVEGLPWLRQEVITPPARETTSAWNSLAEAVQPWIEEMMEAERNRKPPIITQPQDLWEQAAKQSSEQPEEMAG